MSLDTTATTIEREEGIAVKRLRNTQEPIQKSNGFVKLRSVREIFLDKVCRGRLDVIATGDALEFADNYSSEEERYDLIAEGFTNFMNNREFGYAVYYFGMLSGDEKDHIISIRKYKYTLNDMQFKRKYKLEGYTKAEMRFVKTDK